MKKSTSTRLSILQKAFDLIYIKGYQATSIDDILTNIEVTKGAFYYHFKTKDEMGLAIIQEMMLPAMQESYVTALTASSDPAAAIYEMMKHILLDDPKMQARYGCPVGNLSQEMAPLNPLFKEALHHLFDLWEEALRKCISNGKKAGTINVEVNAKQVACFVIAGYWGIRTIGKFFDDSTSYKTYLKELKSYLKSLQ